MNARAGGTASLRHAPGLNKTPTNDSESRNAKSRRAWSRRDFLRIGFAVSALTKTRTTAGRAASGIRSRFLSFDHEIQEFMDFEPGSRYAYSNFGYCILGRVVEKVTGLSYERFVRQQILATIGITRMKIGRTLFNQRADGEVRYYLTDAGMAESVFDEVKGEGAAGVPPAGGLESRALPMQVPWPYGGFCLESMDAHGGWIDSAVDLARFASALDDPERPPLVNPDTQRVMYAPPPVPVSRNTDGSLKDFYYGCGWSVRPAGTQGKANYWHTGSLPGTFSLLVRRHDGLSWVALFNQRSNDSILPDNAIDSALHRAADAVTDWPDEDLFPQHSNTGR